MNLVPLSVERRAHGELILFRARRENYLGHIVDVHRPPTGVRLQIGQLAQY